jgi:hypothetical protein
MIDIQLVELCLSGLIDFSEIKRPIVIGVPRGDGMRGGVCAGLHRKRSGHEQRNDSEASSKANH